MPDGCHFYGGQAILEGVMMRGTKAWGAAVRRTDGQIAVVYETINDFTSRYPWLKWPFIRGSVALVDALGLGLKSLMYSFNVLVDEQMHLEQAKQEAAAETDEKPDGKKKSPAPPKKQAVSGWAVWAAMLPAMALGIGLFMLLPTLVVGWIPFPPALSDGLKNIIEGVVRLIIIAGYIAAISLMPDVKRLFQYHGAEHAVINCFEDGKPITVENCRAYSPLHPRCGTAFLLVFIVVKILLGALFGWPDIWLRLLLRLAMIPFVAAIAYEIIRYGGRNRSSIVARVLAQPGLMLQRLTTRAPEEAQIRVAIYALATVAPEVPLPADFTPPTPAGLDGKLLPPETSETGIPTVAENTQ